MNALTQAIGLSQELPSLISLSATDSVSSEFSVSSRPREKVFKPRQRRRSCAGLGGGGSDQQQQGQFAVSRQWRPPLPLHQLLLGSLSPGGQKRANGPPRNQLQFQIWSLPGFLTWPPLWPSIPRNRRPRHPASPRPPLTILGLPLSRGRQTAAQPFRLNIMGKCLNSRFVELVSIIANCRTPRRTLRPVSAAPPEIWLLPSPRIRFCSNLHLSKTLWEPEKAPGSAFLLSQVIRAWFQSTKCF